jgi:hypothetical protein
MPVIARVVCDACNTVQNVDLADLEHYCIECGAPLDVSEADRAHFEEDEDLGDY